EGPTTTLTFLVSRAVEGRAILLERPDRVIVDLPEVNFQFGPEQGRKGEGLIQSFRYGLFGSGRSRLVIDLTAPALASLVVTPPRADGTVRATLSLQRTDRERYQQAVRALPPAPEPETTAAVQTDSDASDRRPLIVIDPGHGGVDPGAMGKGGMTEKQLVFDVAQKVRDRLEAGGRFRVRMTRDRDVFVTLGERVATARRVQADLFVSIHADMIAGHRDVRGASIYTGSEKATDAEAARLAESENRADAAGGVDSSDDVRSDVADILSDLTRRETRVFSHRFARTLGAQMGEALPMHKKPLREAGFKVLRAPDVPSVLVELGYLSNSTDAEFLVSSAGQDKASDAISKAIESFFQKRAQP
ncbi:MAG: N-acetylmuramoyl-L-alanine amidase, partial [Beijerinckiaceae bacterium]